MIRILSLSLSLLLISLNSHAIDLFGYKLYDNIFKYENDGDIKFKKEIIESISIQEERVLISNKYLKNYVIKATKTGNIYEIHGSNKLLQLNPVECLDIQSQFIKSFQNKNSDEYSTEVKQFPNKLKSKTTWEIYLDSIKDDNKLIFSVTCDYSFNNRRMDIILSDNSYMINENKKYDFLLENKGQTTQVKEIDTSGI